MASEYCLATDENRGGIKQPLPSFHLTLITWLNKCTFLMARKNTEDFIFPSAFMQWSGLTLLVSLMFYFFTPAESTSTHKIICQNCQKGF